MEINDIFEYDGVVYRADRVSYESGFVVGKTFGEKDCLAKISDVKLIRSEIRESDLLPGEDFSPVYSVVSYTVCTVDGDDVELFVRVHRPDGEIRTFSTVRPISLVLRRLNRLPAWTAKNVLESKRWDLSNIANRAWTYSILKRVSAAGKTGLVTAFRHDGRVVDVRMESPDRIAWFLNCAEDFE